MNFRMGHINLCSWTSKGTEQHSHLKRISKTGLQSRASRQLDELTKECPSGRRVQPQRSVHRFTGKIPANPYRNHQVCVSQEVGSARVTSTSTAIIEHREAQPGVSERKEGLSRQHARASRVPVNVRRPAAIGATQ